MDEPPVGDDGVGAPGDGALDLAVLAEVTGGDADLAAWLVDDFLASLHTDLEELEEALFAATSTRRGAVRTA